MTALALVMLLAAAVDPIVPPAIQCNQAITGTLSPGIHDRYEFQGAANQIVTVTGRSLSPALHDLRLTLFPPPGDTTSTTPISAGAPGAMVRHRLQSTGTWAVVIGNSDVNAAGEYIVDMKCTPSSSSTDCLARNILCGQTQTGTLTDQSCRFSNAPQGLYQLHRIYGVAGEVVTIELDSGDFPPQINIYAGEHHPIARALESEPGKARLTYTFLTSELHSIGATSSIDHNRGNYVLNVSCATSGCLEPLILDQPSAVEVPYGQSATLELDVHHIGPIEYLWSEFGDFPRLLATTTVPRWETAPVTGTRHYYVSARSPCGTVDSNVIVVSPQTSRRRAARH